MLSGEKRAGINSDYTMTAYLAMTSFLVITNPGFSNPYL
jgi:hypothetical protein